MKSSNEVWLSLEVLEDRLALSGAFGGAINRGAPSLVPFPFNGMTVNGTVLTESTAGFRGGFADFIPLTFTAGPSVQSQMQAFQSQAQAFQSQAQALQSQFFSSQIAQMAVLDQYFSQAGSLFQSLPLNGLFV